MYKPETVAKVKAFADKVYVPPSTSYYDLSNPYDQAKYAIDCWLANMQRLKYISLWANDDFTEDYRIDQFDKAIHGYAKIAMAMCEAIRNNPLDESVWAKLNQKYTLSEFGVS